MQILMLGWELPPHNSGGLGVACYHMARALSRHGASIDFVLPYTAHHPETEFMTIISTSSEQPIWGEKKGSGAYDDWIEHAEKMAKLQEGYINTAVTHAKQSTPDVIHAHDWLTLKAGMAVKQAVNRPLVAHIHATEFDRAGGKGGNPIIHEIEYEGLMMADRIIAVSNLTKQILIDRYQLPADKIEVIHNTINHEELDALPDVDTYLYAERMKREGYCVVATVGRLTIQKGLHHFMRAAAKAARRLNRFVFIVAGDGEQRDELIELSAELGIADSVLFTGFVRGKALRDVYGVADVFVMSSISEPFGLTALEAAADRDAVVITKQSGASEVLTNSLKYDYWDEDRLADILINLASSSALTSHLQMNAAEEIQHTSWHDIASHCLDQYTRAIQGLAA